MLDLCLAILHRKHKTPTEKPVSKSPNTDSIIGPALFLIGLAATATIILSVDQSQLWGRYSSALWNAGHIVIPALFTIFAHHCFSNFAQSNFWHRLLRANLIALLLGLVIEQTQGTIDYKDIGNNQIGVCLGFALLGLFRGVKGSRLPALLFMAILLIGAVLLNHALIFNLVDEFRMRQAFPVIVDFEQSLQRSRFYKPETSDQALALGRVNEITNEENSAAQALEFVINAEQRYEGIELIHLVPEWSDYKTLHLRLMNSELIPQPEVTIRVQDKTYFEQGKQFHDRYNQDFILHSNWNQIDIDLEAIRNAPLEREMAMDEIRYIGIYAIAALNPNSIYIDKIWLD